MAHIHHAGRLIPVCFRAPRTAIVAMTVAGALGGAVTAQASANASMRVAAPKEAATGDTVVVTLRAERAGAPAGYQAALRFDHARAELLGVHVAGAGKAGRRGAQGLGAVRHGDAEVFGAY